MTYFPQIASSEHHIRIRGREDEHIILKIKPDSIEFSGSPSFPNKKFTHEEAEKAIKLNAAKFKQYTFLATIESRVICVCSEETYTNLEQWFRYEALIRMEFRSDWLPSLVFGGFTIYDALTPYRIFGFTKWVLLDFLIGGSLLITGALGKMRPSRFLLLLHIFSWCLFVFRTLYALSMNHMWLYGFPLLVSLFSLWHLCVRYSRLGKLQARI